MTSRDRAGEQRTGVRRPRRGRRATWQEDAECGARVSWSNVAFASVWLVFLASPAVAIVSGDAPFATKAFGAAGLLAFVALYVTSWAIPRPVRALSWNASALAWVAVLVLCLLAMAPAAGPYVFAAAPFLMAVLTFRLPVRAAIVGALTVATAVLALVYGRYPQQLVWVLPMMLTCTVIFVIMRSTGEHEERSRAIAHELDLSRQREEFARDVHDVLGHSLTVVAVKTELARRLLDRDPERARAELDDVLALTRESLAEVRSTVGRLRSPVWASQLASARTALEAAGIEAALPSDPTVVPQHQQEVFAWCLREAVTNVVRHSGATRCAVTTEPGRLVITDDGVGLAPGTPEGNGLRGLRERVTALGGEMTVTQAALAPVAQDRLSTDRSGPGVRIEVVLP